MVSDRSTLNFQQSVALGGPDQLRVAKLTDYTAEIVRSLFARPEDLRACRADAGHRADRVKKKQVSFFADFAPEARQILNDLLEKYAADGELQFNLPDVLKVPPISHHGNVAEIISKFGGPDQLRNAVNQLQWLLYAA